MYPFSQQITPAVRTHLDAQTAFVNDMSKSMFKSFQDMFNLNIQLMQTMLEETTLTSQQMITANRQSELLSAATSRAQPTSEKLRAYQQHLSRVAADTQVELARVAEQHVQHTTRTAREVADEAARRAAEQAERGIQAQQDAARNFTDPFKSGARDFQSEQGRARAGNGGAGVTMQSGQQGSAQGNTQDKEGVSASASIKQGGAQGEISRQGSHSH